MRLGAKRQGTIWHWIFKKLRLLTTLWVDINLSWELSFFFSSIHLLWKIGKVFVQSFLGLGFMDGQVKDNKISRQDFLCSEFHNPLAILFIIYFILSPPHYSFSPFFLFSIWFIKLLHLINKLDLVWQA